MASPTNLHELFLHELRDIADAEEQLTEALPKMAKAAQHEPLRQAIQDHLQETESHLQKVTELLERFDATRGRVKCEGMKGLIEEGGKMLKLKVDPDVRDAGIIAAAQKVEHYEMAAYGTLKAWAQLMRHDEAAAVIEQILSQEKAADEKLTRIAMSINPQANNGAGMNEPEIVTTGRKTAASSRMR